MNDVGAEGQRLTVTGVVFPGEEVSHQIKGKKRKVVRNQTKNMPC